MMKQKVILISTIALVFPLVLTGCYSVERAQLKADLEEAEYEIDSLQTRLEAIEQSPVRADAPSELQQAVDEFIKIRDALQRREDELNRLRQAALAEAQTARTLMDKLAAQLQAETDKVTELQNQLQQTQQSITELQNKLE